MNILFITNHLNSGGITSYVLSLSKGLKDRGHNIYLASSAGQLLNKFQEEGINFIPIPIKTKKEISPKIALSFFRLKSFIEKNHIDLVHTHSRTTQVLGCLLHKFTGVRHISTCHGFFKRRFLRRMFPCWGEMVIAISEPVKEHLIKDFRVEEKNIMVIHNGIEADRFRALDFKSGVRSKKELGLGDGAVIGIVARLSDVKGHIYLIEAMKIVLNNDPSAQLLIVGEGKEKENLRKKTDGLGITKSVFFIPDVPDTIAALAAIDIFVMPSLKEGLGLALMEAMAAGLPVIGSNVGGIKSLIQDGLNGILVEPADSKGLAEAILKLLKDSKKRESLGGAAQKFIAKSFSLERMIIDTEKVYKNA